MLGAVMMKKNKSLKTRAQGRMDAWANPLSGQGYSDKSRGKQFIAGKRLMQQQLSELFANDWLARKVCEKPAKDATRKGITFKEKGQESLETEFLLHQFFTKAKDGIAWGRLYGGAAMIFIVNDGKEASEPLVFADVIDLVDIMVVDRFYLTAEGINTDYMSVHYGTPSHYRLNGGTLFHASRISKFMGAPMTYDKRMENQGWGGSYVQLYWDAIADFQGSMADLRFIMSESSLGILSVPGLTNAKAMGGKAVDAVMNRAAIFNTYKSIYRTAVIDTEEDFDYINRSLAGLSDIADKFMTNISGAVDMPQLILFGTTPSGLNASQDEQLETYHDSVGTIQESDLTPAIIKFIGCVTKGATVTWEYKPLSQLTDVKLAEVRNKEANTLSLIYEQCAFTPEMGVRFLNDTGHFQIEEEENPDLSI